MFKVLLVDDEANVRQGVRMMIPWEDIGCYVIGEADDGDDGLSKIMTLSPDIVIADVKMPGKTGIEMTEAAKALGFKGKVIILSGYSDFSYAKTAISLGVENFILKPVDENELIDAIRTAGDKIRKEQERRYRQEAGREYLNEQLIKGLFAGDSMQIAEVMGKYKFPCYCAAIVICDKASEFRGEVYRQIRRYFEAVSDVDIVSVDINGALGILFKGWDSSEAADALEKMRGGFGDSIFIACGQTVDSPTDIYKSYASAGAMIKNKFIFRHCGIVIPDTLKNTPQIEDQDFAGRIYAFMEINDTEKMGRVIDTFMESMLTRDNTPEKAKITCINMVRDVRSRFNRSVADKKPEDYITDEFIAGLGDMDSLWEMLTAVKQKFKSVSDSYFGRTTKSTMERVVQYIRANYNQELRLEMLAGIFGYNSAYLGKVFHQYTGENFNNYIDEIRITEAKRLLESEEYKVYEVAEMVGYSNINYFHNKFKKYVGMSPLSYKKKNGKSD